MEEKPKYKRGHNPNSRRSLIPLKKGVILNPEGARAHDPAKRELKRLTSESLKEVIDIAVKNDVFALREMANSTSAPVIQVAVAKCMIIAIDRGDWATVQSIIERIVGKVPVVIDNLSSDGSMNVNVRFHKPDGA